MKFTDGMWMTKEGYTFHWAEHAERVYVKDDNQGADLLLVKRQNWVGDSLNTPSITASLRSPREGILAAKFTHWDGEDEGGPHFELFEDEKPSVKLDNVPEKQLQISTGPLDLTVDTSRNNLSFQYTNSRAKTDVERRLTGHSFRSVGFVSSRDTPTYSIADGLYAEEKNYMLLEFDISVHEQIYGLGERFGPLVKNGQSIDVWNEDGGTSSEQTYKNVPFFVSSRGYGVFINHPGRVMLEVQSERTTRVNIAVEGESLEYMVIAGPTLKEVLSRYTSLTGRAALPPAWSYGLWLTTSFQTSYAEDVVSSFLDGLKKRSIPLSVFHLDACWMKTFQWCDFIFDEAQFPDPKGYISRIKARGHRLCVWMNPYVGQASPLFAEGKKNGYFIMRADTRRPTVWQWDEWQAGCAVVDFTNPEARTWFSSHLHRLMDLGVDSFKTDFGERIPFDPKKVKYHDGSDPVRMHNFYAFLYQKTVWECVQAHSSHTTGAVKGENPVLFARPGTTGSQRYPVHWGGDCESTFPAMAETIRGGLSLSLSGFGFWAHDIGGFEGLPDPALYKRWVQFGLLSSHSRLHGSSSYRVPWMFEEKYPGEDEKCSRVLREATLRKLALMPYILRQGLEAHRNGTPVMRALFLEFENDFTTWNVDTQFMLGSDLLVAPVLDASGWVRFYVPETGTATGAKWRSWFDHTKTYEEGKWYVETHDFNTLPLLIRPGAVIPFNPSLKDPEADYLKGLQVLVNGPIAGDTDVEIVLPSDVYHVGKTFTVAQDLTVRSDGVEVVDLTKKSVPAPK
ncbi:Alpha-xylosidase [Exophiala dermatitidis]